MRPEGVKRKKEKEKEYEKTKKKRKKKKCTAKKMIKKRTGEVGNYYSNLFIFPYFPLLSYLVSSDIIPPSLLVLRLSHFLI